MNKSIPKVGEVWIDYTEGIPNGRKCTITEVYKDHYNSMSVRFRVENAVDDFIRDWLLEDFLVDAVLAEDYIVDSILTKYSNG